METVARSEPLTISALRLAAGDDGCTRAVSPRRRGERTA